MKLSGLRQDIADGYGFIMVNKEVVARFERKEAEELLTDIDAEIAKARQDEAAKVGQMNVRHFDGGGNELVKASTHRAFIEMVHRRFESIAEVVQSQRDKIGALEASEVELREHCQGNVPMSVFNDLKKRVDSLVSDTSSLGNATTREFRALAERVKALEPKSLAAEDDAWDDWRELPWGESGLEAMAGGRVVYAEKAIEAAFRAGFRAGRK